MIFPLVATWGHPYLAGPLGLVNWLVAGFAIIHYFVSCNPLNLAGGLEHFFFSILGISLSQLTNIFQMGRYTTNQLTIPRAPMF